MAKIATVISFCTNDARFLKELVERVRTISAQILIPVCDHFYDGSLENYAVLENLYSHFPDCTFLEFAFDPEKPYGYYSAIDRDHPAWGRHWHSTARLVASLFLRRDIEEVLFLDADEIPEVSRFSAWLERFDRKPFSALRFASYWYFRTANTRGTTYQDTALLIKREALTSELILNINERKGMLANVEGNSLSEVLGLDGLPLFHHYSWVRSKEELLKKTRTWGHRADMDWQRLIEQEFARPFNGQDWFRDYDYVSVENHFDPLMEPIPAQGEATTLVEHRNKIAYFPNVQRVTAQEVFRKEVMREVERA